MDHSLRWGRGVVGGGLTVHPHAHDRRHQPRLQRCVHGAEIACTRVGCVGVALGEILSERSTKFGIS
jgi:hypothetical protein